MAAGPLSLLDNIRLNNGTEGLKNYIHNLFRNDREKALEMVNDHNLRFGTLFLLRHELSATAIRGMLNPLYRKALEITEELMAKKTAGTEKVLRTGKEDTAAALGWMIQTGYIEGETDKEYDQLMEHSAAMLTRSFRDTSVLPLIAEMIFERHRNGKLIHELVWAFFEARSTDSLGLIAQRLYSPDSRDVTLAKRLLCFIPAIREDSSATGPIPYARALHWLQENKPFLYYTGESLHLCNSPMHYAVSWVAKYLCHPVSADNGEPLLPLNGLEKNLSSQFRELSDKQQQQLADFSQMLCRRNIYQWNTWIRLPLNEQARLASHMMGGLTW